MKQLKNVKFGENVLCEDSVGSKTFEFGGATINASGATINWANICGGAISTDNLSLATCGGTFNLNGGIICGGSIYGDYFSFASCGGRFYGNGGTIDLGSGYLESAIIGSTCRISGATIEYPTVSGGSLYDVSIGGSSTYIYDANISGANLYNMINNYGTISGGSIADVMLGGSISNHGTINGGVVSNFTLCGLITNDGTISGGVISGSRLEYVSFTCGDTVSGNYATIENINLSGAGKIGMSTLAVDNLSCAGTYKLYVDQSGAALNVPFTTDITFDQCDGAGARAKITREGDMSARSLSLASCGGYFDCNGADVKNIGDIYYNNTRFYPQESGNQLVFVKG